MFSAPMFEVLEHSDGKDSLCVNEKDLCKIIRVAMDTVTSGPENKLNFFGIVCRTFDLVPEGEIWHVRGDRVIRKVQIWKGKTT